MIKRLLEKALHERAKGYPIIAVMGPRQSGKTTLVRAAFPGFSYVSLEDIDTRRFAQNDPRGFLLELNSGAIIDEMQRVPELFSYMQTIVDESNKPGQFIITGSQNFLLHEKISQSLAGRIALLRLLPFSIEELKDTKYSIDNLEKSMFHGFYPRVFHPYIEVHDWYSSYLQTYVERDVRQIKNVTNLNQFQDFLQLCAGRIGQLLNLSTIASECGITHNTAKAWISVLEASFIVFLLRPHHKNFNKHIVKMPKLYFHDIGLACSLLGIESEKQITTHYFKGSLFENFILTELIKYQYNRGKEPRHYFWRDQIGHEIDYLTEQAGEFTASIEIKAGKTVNSDYWKGLRYWQKLSNQSPNKSFVIYGGDENQKRQHGNLLSWRNTSELFRDTIG